MSVMHALSGPVVRAQRIRRADPWHPRLVELPVPSGSGFDDAPPEICAAGTVVGSPVQMTEDLDHVGPATMSPALAVHDWAALDDVCTQLLASRAPAVAVIDDNDGLLGVITRTDLLRAMAEHGPRATAADAMSRFVLVMPVGVPIERAAALMAYEAVGQIVITDEHGTVVGMLTALDVARHCARHAGYVIAR